MNEDAERRHIISLTDAAWLSGLETADIRWLEERGRFPRALRLHGRNNRVILSFVRAEVEQWVAQRLLEHRAGGDADAAPAVPQSHVSAMLAPLHQRLLSY
jgi:predicted DNA-binding transcriptional regulator AlpA